MLYGLYFYWVCWIIWVLLVFFQFFHANRFIICCWLFLLMITFSVYVPVLHYHFSVSFLILLIGTALIYVHTNVSIRSLFIIFTIMTAYMTVRIWEVIAPIWFFIPPLLMIPFFISVIASIVESEFEHRFIYIIFAMSFGELFHSLILNSYHLSNEIVSLLFFDLLAITILIIVCGYIVRYISFNLAKLLTQLFMQK